MYKIYRTGGGPKIVYFDGPKALRYKGMFFTLLQTKILNVFVY